MIYTNAKSFQRDFKNIPTEIKTDTSKTPEKIYATALPYFQAISAGVLTGISILTFHFALTELAQSFGVKMISSETAGAAYEEFLKTHLLESIVLGPIIEEIAFRSILLGGIHDLIKDFLPDMEIGLYFGTMKLAILVSIVAGAAIFGLVHLSNGIGMAQVVLASLSGIALGILHHTYGEHGLIASSVAHITVNGTVIGLLILGAQ